MKYFIELYKNTNLVLKILIGIIIGIALALLIPNILGISILGKLFVGALKAIAPILVFILVLSSITQATQKSDGRFRKVIFLYIISTFFAACAAVLTSFIFPQTILFSTDNAISQTAPANIGDVVYNLVTNIIVNPITSLTEGNYLGILFWAVVAGISLKGIVSDETKKVLNDFANGVSGVVKWIINLAPIGIMGLVYSAVGSNGMEIFHTYGKIIFVLVGCMLFVCFVTNPFIVYIMTKKNPYPLVLKCLKESGLTAFFTRSSAANIPVNMSLCEKLGLDKDMYSVSIPLGATINMNGAAVTITIMTLTAANTLGISVDFIMALLLSTLATFAACGASGVTGGSLLLIPLACSMFGISNDIAMQVVGVGFIIGVIQDSMETALNSSSDVLFTATAELSNK